MAVFERGVSIWRKEDFEALRNEQKQLFGAAIDELGINSAMTQQLHTPITSIEKFIDSEHVIYIISNDDAVPMGFLRTGEKHLFVYDREGKMMETTCKCVLDFYVSESQQRQGLGLQLFMSMLEHEGVGAAELAFDRPSEKLIGFLRKHFALVNGIMQPNRYLVFEPFFR